MQNAWPVCQWVYYDNLSIAIPALESTVEVFCLCCSLDPCPPPVPPPLSASLLFPPSTCLCVFLRKCQCIHECTKHTHLGGGWVESVAKIVDSGTFSTFYCDAHLWYWYFNDIYHDTTGHKLIELHTMHQM